MKHFDMNYETENVPDPQMPEFEDLSQTLFFDSVEHELTFGVTMLDHNTKLLELTCTSDEHLFWRGNYDEFVKEFEPSGPPCWTRHGITGDSD